MVGLAAALSADKAAIVGHDWGAPVAWHAALFRPDRFRGVIGLSVPFRPRGSDAADERDAGDRDIRLLPTLFPDARRRRGGAGARSSRRDPQGPLFGFGRPAASVGAVDGRPRAGNDSAQAAASSPGRRTRSAFPPGSPKPTSTSTPASSPAPASGRPQLVPEYRPQLGTDGAVRRNARHGPGALVAGDRDLVVNFAAWTS